MFNREDKETLLAALEALNRQGQSLQGSQQLLALYTKIQSLNETENADNE